MTTTPKQQTLAPRTSIILWGIFLDVGIGLIAYFGLRLAGFETYFCLLGASIVTGIRLLIGLVRQRRISGFAVFMLIGFLIGMGLSFVTGDDRFLLLKDSFLTAAFSIVLFGSCVLGKPFMYHASKRFGAAGSAQEEEWERKWRELPRFRRLFRFITAIWGIAFLVDSLVRIPIVYELPIDMAAVVAGLLTPTMLVGLLIWSLAHARRAERRAQARVGGRMAVSSGAN
ncbi:MAG TPA: VC0807 family protein [Pseudonocardiaceae bacterium]|nr:VC0807 family protein [Pseudonocardiaceae bacterium]